MNPYWIAFLQSNGATHTADDQLVFTTEITPGTDKLYPLSHLGVFSVSGKDAETFLQGQVTYDVKSLKPHENSFAALCNPSGKVISPLIIVKNAESFSIILPKSLLPKVIQTLKKYTLRAQVLMSEETEQLCLLGVNPSALNLLREIVPDLDMQTVAIKTPDAQLNMIITRPDQAENLWKSSVLENRLAPGNSIEWEFIELSKGIPWIDQGQSEQYIPQMLNIDKLNGISLDKGCYTGQEVVARSHYLGKVKRELFLAESRDNIPQNFDDRSIINAQSGQAVGKLLTARRYNETSRCLLVLSNTDQQLENLTLAQMQQVAIKIIPFQ